VTTVSFLRRLLAELIWVVLFPAQYIPGAIGSRVRRIVWRFFLGGMGKRVNIDVGVQFVNPQCIFIGDDTWIDKYAILIAGPPHEGMRSISRKPNLDFPAKEGELHIGSRCHIAAQAVIQAHGGVWIGDELTIASGARIYSMSHHYRPLNQPHTKFYRFSSNAREEDQALIISPIVIKTGAAVGLNSVVLAGSVIGENSWVATNSLVRGRVPPNSIAAGIPANVIRKIVLEPPDSPQALDRVD
jgi:acetyltransferase-like isoleucine patch superfamily enzyme